MTAEVRSILAVKINRNKKLRSKSLKHKLKSIDISFEKAITACKAAYEKKGENITLLNVSKLTIISDYFVIITANSKPHLQILSRYIEEILKNNFNAHLISQEGVIDNVWSVLDFGDIIVHIMLEDERNYYKLESFWRNATFIDSKVWKKAS